MVLVDFVLQIVQNHWDKNISSTVVSLTLDIYRQILYLFIILFVYFIFMFYYFADYIFPVSYLVDVLDNIIMYGVLICVVIPLFGTNTR